MSRCTTHYNDQGNGTDDEQMNGIIMKVADSRNSSGPSVRNQDQQMEMWRL